MEKLTYGLLRNVSLGKQSEPLFSIPSERLLGLQFGARISEHSQG